MKNRWFAIFSGVMLLCVSRLLAQPLVPDWVAYPGKQWQTITPEAAGLDVSKWNDYLLKIRQNAKGFLAGGQNPTGKYGAVICRGGFLLAVIGDGDLKMNSASVGKAFNKIALQLAIDAGYINSADDFIKDYWTGRGLMSHPFKEMDKGHHARLTFNHLDFMRGGFPISNGNYWKCGKHPAWAKWTGDPTRDNYAHRAPGQTHYSSGGMWRLNQAMTAILGKELKSFLDQELFRHIGIKAENWKWFTGRQVYENKDFYPAMPGYGLMCDPPYEINGKRVYGGGGWVVMTPRDLGRLGLLVSTRGIWKGKRLISDTKLLAGHAGFNSKISLMDGKGGDTMISIGKVNWGASKPTLQLNEIQDMIIALCSPTKENR